MTAPPRPAGPPLGLRLLPALMTVAALAFAVRLTHLLEELVTGRPVLGLAYAAEGAETPAEAASGAAATAATPSPGGVSGVMVATNNVELWDRLAEIGVSTTEIELLRTLARRREQLDGRAASLDAREAVLAAAETRLAEKVAELEGLRGQLQGMMQQRDEAAETRLAELVKIYETMKPKDAAAIFETLDMAVLIEVVDRMKAAKSAPILAQMSPERAREVTALLAARDGDGPGTLSGPRL